MTQFDTTAEECTDLDERDVRALTEKMTVLDDVGQARGAADMYVVTTQSGREYTVDLRFKSCECPDAEHRDPDGGCKHVRRTAFATGERPLPTWVNLDVVDEQLGDHVNGPVAADGGTVVATDPKREALDEDVDLDQDHDQTEPTDDVECACELGEPGCFEHYEEPGDE